MTQLVVSVEDYSLISDIKRAIKMLKGVADVKLVKPKKNGLDKAIEDIENGNVYAAKDMDDFVKQMMQ